MYVDNIAIDWSNHNNNNNKMKWNSYIDRSFSIICLCVHICVHAGDYMAFDTVIYVS